MEEFLEKAEVVCKDVWRAALDYWVVGLIVSFMLLNIPGAVLFIVCKLVDLSKNKHKDD